MSTSKPFPNDRNLLDDYREYESMSPRERTLGHLLVILVILLAILLRSL